MSLYTFGQAVREAIYDEMREDENIVFMGEDIRYNLYAYSEGLWKEFGDERVIDVPLSESAVVGTAIGAAMCGLRPIVDLTVSNFLYVAMDQIIDMASKIRYQYGNQYRVPITILAGSSYGAGVAAQHSDRPHSMFMNAGGIDVVIPSNVQDMYAMLRASIQSDDPVICFMDKTLFYQSGELNERKIGKLGQASLVRSGHDITVAAIGGCVQMAQEAARIIEAQYPITVEVLDVCSLSPLDEATILQSVRKTGRLVVVDFANKICSAASEIASVAAEKAFYDLKGPVKIVASETIPMPYATSMEKELIPSVEKIVKAIQMLQQETNPGGDL